MLFISLKDFRNQDEQEKKFLRNKTIFNNVKLIYQQQQKDGYTKQKNV